MNRRPWPLVLMAILQFLSPLIYLTVAALFYHLSLSSTTNEILALTPGLRQFEIFVMPILLGALILFTRKAGYYLVIVGSLYLIVRGIMEYVASNETDPVFPLVISNILCAIVVGTLLKSTNRSVYFNPRLRWWETDPRYVVNLTASITRVGASPSKAALQNIAVGGAGLETDVSDFLKEEVVTLEFQNAGETYRLKSKIVWEKPTGNGKQFLGLEWTDDNASTEWSKIRRLVRGLKAKRADTTRAVPPRLASVKEWFSKLSG